jgi:hypothetical protein
MVLNNIIKTKHNIICCVIEYNIITGRKSVRKLSSSSTSNIFATASASYTITYYRFQNPVNYLAPEKSRGIMLIHLSHAGFYTD